MTRFQHFSPLSPHFQLPPPPIPSTRHTPKLPPMGPIGPTATRLPWNTHFPCNKRILGEINTFLIKSISLCPSYHRRVFPLWKQGSKRGFFGGCLKGTQNSFVCSPGSRSYRSCISQAWLQFPHFLRAARVNFQPRERALLPVTNCCVPTDQKQKSTPKIHHRFSLSPSERQH